MTAPRPALMIALGLMLLAASDGASAEPPKISRPRPASSVPLQVEPLPLAQFDDTLAVGGQDVKARKLSTRLSVDVNVNGHGPYRFVVDSGADTSAVGLHIAHDLQLPLGDPVILNATTSRDLVDRVRVDSLSLGASTIRDIEVPALKEEDLGDQGLIGIDALVQQRLMMDFEKHLIKVEDARIPVISTPGEIVIVAHRRRGQLILTAVRAAGLPLDAVIDTGSEVTIGNSALREKLLHKYNNFYSVDATGVTGVTMKLQMATIPHLQLGPIVLADVPIAFADVPPFELFGLSKEPALLLGTDLLSTFRRVSLDFRARKVRFQLRHCGPEGIIINTSPSGLATRLSSAGGPEVCAS